MWNLGNGDAKVVIITGCSSGVGSELAAQLSGLPGYIVYATARRLESLDHLRVSTQHRNVRTKRIDVTDEASVLQAVSEIYETEGRIDVLVNNAGYSLFGGIEQVSIADCEKQFDTNVWGAARMIKAVAPHMRAQKSGFILCVSSIGGIWGQPLNDVYCASKFALEGLVESMAPVYREFGVHVSVIEPGAIRSNFLKNCHYGSGAKDLSPDFQTIYDKVMAYYSARMSDPNNKSGQTPDQVAKACLELIEMEDPPPRAQCNPAVQGLIDMKCHDVDGRKMLGVSKNAFFKDM